MVNLATKNPSVHGQFLVGNLTVKKTTCAFSTIAFNQAHERNNTIVKCCGWSLSLTETPAALHCWMVSGPQMALVILEFQAMAEKR